MSNPKSDAAQKQVGIDNAFSATKQGDASAVNNQLFPFLSGELNNPQGFGDDTVSKMKTEGGQAVAGAQGQATEAAQLLGSRTGNTAAAPGIIDAASRNAMRTNSDNALGIDVDNAKAKLLQQQGAASGLGSQYSQDTQAAMQALGLGGNAISGISSGPGIGWSGDTGLSFHF